MVSMSSSRRIASIFARGTITSCTVISPTSNRFIRIDRCFFGMKLDDSSTRVRISAGDRTGASAFASGRTRRTQSRGLTKRFTNHAGRSSARRASLTGKDSRSAARSGCVAPITFGVISENTMTRKPTTMGLRK